MINANGLRDPNERMSFLQWLSHLEVEFVCILELHISSCIECDLWFSASGLSVVASPRTLHSCGSAILYRPSFSLFFV